MAVRIIGLAGSPRKGGNTDMLLETLLAAAEAEKAKVNKIYLNGKKIRACQACYACRKTGKCKQKDDMTKIYKKLMKADVWVFASPVYWWGPSAQLKLALDRMFALCHGGKPEKIKGKKFVLLAASEDDPKKAAPHLLGMMKEAVGYLQMEWAGQLLVQAYKKGEVGKDKAALQKAAALGKKLAG